MNLKLNEHEIFEELFKTALKSKDKKGAVAASIVWDGKILATSASSDDGLYHAEFLVIQMILGKNIDLSQCVLYSTLEPCSQRNSPAAQKIGDCTSHIINSGIKEVVVGVMDPVEGKETKDRFLKSGVRYSVTKNIEISKKCLKIFNDSCENPKHKIHINFN